MESASPTTRRQMLEPVREILDQGRALLAEISDEDYTRKLPVAFNASIGGHYRHCLDHFHSLLEAAEQGDLDYDLRERGTLVENDRYAALNATNELREALTHMDPESLARPLGVACKTGYASGGSQSAPSTLGREVMYIVAHAVHHYALIAIMAGMMGVKTPAAFGVAPATLEHQVGTNQAER